MKIVFEQKETKALKGTFEAKKLCSLSTVLVKFHMTKNAHARKNVYAMIQPDSTYFYVSVSTDVCFLDISRHYGFVVFISSTIRSKIECARHIIQCLNVSTQPYKY
ncbi:CLUMA_CG019301, isoform A [Clunio marinus]|uniref:CLUMA_CG019301, isoform A n=1 Tax=Clunio marinus TaxID=568069 RepID=A0A1J1J140_9DIPT|nr:CLUMA_CG019301, isoform A [Clunio marinus]